MEQNETKHLIKQELLHLLFSLLHSTNVNPCHHEAYTLVNVPRFSYSFASCDVWYVIRISLVIQC
jgi:hypothetical protein